MDYGLQIAKLLIGLISLIFVLRLLGKQSLSQMNPYDLVYIIVLGGVLDSTFYDDKIGLFPYLFSILVWSLGIFAIEVLVRKNETVRLFFRGRPDQILANGKLNMKALRKNNMEMEELRMLLRKQGIFTLEEVRDIYLETDGSISLIKYKDLQGPTKKDLNIKDLEDEPSVLLVDDGVIEYQALKYINKSKEWLLDELSKINIYDLSSILYCEWASDKGFFVKTDKDTLVIRDKGYPN